MHVRWDLIGRLWCAGCCHALLSRREVADCLPRNRCNNGGGVITVLPLAMGDQCPHEERHFPLRVLIPAPHAPHSHSLLLPQCLKVAEGWSLRLRIFGPLPEAAPPSPPPSIREQEGLGGGGRETAVRALTSRCPYLLVVLLCSAYRGSSGDSPPPQLLPRLSHWPAFTLNPGPWESREHRPLWCRSYRHAARGGVLRDLNIRRSAGDGSRVLSRHNSI